MNDTLNNTLSGKQNPFRAAITAKKKKKAHQLLMKASEKSKKKTKGVDYNAKLKKKGKKMSLKKKANRGETDKAKAQF